MDLGYTVFPVLTLTLLIIVLVHIEKSLLQRTDKSDSYPSHDGLNLETYIFG